MNRVSYFEFASPDPAKEMDFFKSLFGWEFQKFGDQDYWLVTTGRDEVGIDGGFLPLMDERQPRTTNTITAASIDDAIVKATGMGATMMMDKTEIPNFGYTAYMMSPTGIPFGLFEAIPGGSM